VITTVLLALLPVAVVSTPFTCTPVIGPPATPVAPLKVSVIALAPETKRPLLPSEKAIVYADAEFAAGWLKATFAGKTEVVAAPMA
jgi:hypothetical protein